MPRVTFLGAYRTDSDGFHWIMMDARGKLVASSPAHGDRLPFSTMAAALDGARNALREIELQEAA